MNDYLVTVYTYLPYKREYSYTVKGSGLAVALRRGIDKFRKEPAIKGRKVKELTAKVIAL